MSRLGTIYICQCANNGPIKVGITFSTIEQRMKNLQIACPYDLVLLSARAGTREDEQAILDQFSAHRIRGEWFEPAPDLLSLAVERGIMFSELPAPQRPKHISPILKEVERFIRDNGIHATEFGSQAVSDPNFVFELRAGRNPGPAVCEKVREYIAPAEAVQP